jgi:hypothetical protein
MPYFNELRINEALLGRVLRAKRNDEVVFDQEPNPFARVSDTCEAPGEQLGFHEWVNLIRKENEDRARLKAEQEQKELEWKTNIEHFTERVMNSFTKIN